MSRIDAILREKDIQKAAEIFGLEEATIKKFNDLRLLNVEYIFECLVRYDYQKLSFGIKLSDLESNKKRMEQAIGLAIRKEYNISKKLYNSIINETTTRKKMFFCDRCGKRMSMAEYNSGDGICTTCKADDILI